MADEAEQSRPAEAAPAAEAPIVESIPAESVAADQAPEGSAPVPDAVPDVATETRGPVVAQSQPATPSDPAPISQQTTTPVPQPSSSILPATDLARRGLAARRERREAKLQKIIGLVKKEVTIGSKDIQKYLHVSDSAATDYLNELVKRGTLKRVGPRSRARYELL